MASDRDGTGLRSLAEASASLGLPKAPTGIQWLDAITGAGLPRATSTLVTGGTGSGMTLPGLQFLVSSSRAPGSMASQAYSSPSCDTGRTRPDPGPRHAEGPPRRGVQVMTTLRSGYAGYARRGSP